MITGSPVPESAGWVPIPIQTARDPRLTRRALGLLVELLSYPPGWDNSADRLSAKRGEGRDATRAAMAALENAGYVIHLRYRAERGRWLTASFAGSSPETARSLADAWLAEHPESNAKQKPSSDRRTGFQASDNQASADQSSESQAFNTYKTDDNTDDKKDLGVDAAGAASITLPAPAGSKESDDADASSAAAKAAAREDAHSAKPRKPKPPTLDQRLDAYLQALGAEVIDEMYRDLDNDRTGITMWAVKKARKALGLGWVEPEDDPGGPLARKAVALALMALSKPDGGGITPTVEGLLGDFDWPDERAPSAARLGAKERPSLSRVKYFVGPDGATDDDVHQILYKQVDALADEELTARIEQLRTYRPGIYRECSASAAAQAERGGGEWSTRRLDNLTFKYAIRHYEGRWPMFVVPTSERGTA